MYLRTRFEQVLEMVICYHLRYNVQINQTGILCVVVANLKLYTADTAALSDAKNTAWDNVILQPELLGSSNDKS